MTNYEKIADERDEAIQEMHLAVHGSTHENYLRLRVATLTDKLLHMTREEAEREVVE
jgi:hypothetical protein